MDECFECGMRDERVKSQSGKIDLGRNSRNALLLVCTLCCIRVRRCCIECRVFQMSNNPSHRRKSSTSARSSGLSSPVRESQYSGGMETGRATAGGGGDEEGGGDDEEGEGDEDDDDEDDDEGNDEEGASTSATLGRRGGRRSSR